MSSQFFEGKKLLIGALGDCVINTFNLAHIKDSQSISNMAAIDTPLYTYNENSGVYNRIPSKMALSKLFTDKVPNITPSQLTSAITYIKTQAPIITRSKHNLVAFKGAILNLDTVQEVKPSPSTVVTADMTHLVYDRTKTDSPILDEFMTTLFGEDTNKHKLIYEIIGYGLADNNFMQKFFIFYGKGGDGKSTLLNLIIELYGRHNVSNISLQDITNRFRISNLQGKMLNVGDDIGKTAILDSADLKKIVTGDTIIIERKGEQPFSYTPRAKMLFSSNEVPRINDTSRGMNDRLMVVPFGNRLRGTGKANPNIIADLIEQGALTVLLNRAIDGLNRLLLTRAFTHCADVEEMTKKEILNNNNAKLFIDEVENGDLTVYELGLSDEYMRDCVFIIDKAKGTNVYRAYRNWCRDNGYSPYSRRRFGEIIEDSGYIYKNIRNGNHVYKAWSHKV